jgi:hypothetical protein
LKADKCLLRGKLPIDESAPRPRGLIERMEDYGVASDAVDPGVAAFFLDPGALDLEIESRWRFPFSSMWRLVNPIMRWIGQLAYPIGKARIRTAAYALEAGADGREGARAILREYADGSATMHAVAYATWNQMMSAAFPLPGCCLMGVLKLSLIDGGGVVLRSQGAGTGVWLIALGVAIPLPFGEDLELRPGDGDVTMVARHEQRLFGIRMVTHHYRFTSCASTENSNLTEGT